MPGLRLCIAYLLVFAFVCVVQSFNHSRGRRGASVYPVFGTGGHAVTVHHGAPPLAQFVGASSHRGGTYDSGNTGSAFDTNLLNSYSQSSHRSSPTPAPSNSGWIPISGHGTGLTGGTGSSGYGGSFHTAYGSVTPNFANAGPSRPTSHRPQAHSLSANALAQAAQTSFYAQNSYFDSLLAGAPRPTYKGNTY